MRETQLVRHFSSIPASAIGWLLSLVFECTEGRSVSLAMKRGVVPERLPSAAARPAWGRGFVASKVGSGGVGLQGD